MKEMLKGKLEIIEFFKKYFTEKRKAEFNNEIKLVNKLNDKMKNYTQQLNTKYDKKIDKKLQKIYDLKSGKIQIINVNRYIKRILLLILFYISLFNLSLNLKVYNHFIHVLVMFFIILSSLSVLITFIIKKKIFDAYYFNFNLKKLIPIFIFFVGIGYFLNSYKNTLEALNNKSILIRGAEMDSISELKNSTLEISNKEGKIKWKVDKNLKIITHEDSKNKNMKIMDTVIEDNNKVNLSFTNDKGEVVWIKGKIISFDPDTVKITLKDKRVIQGEVYGKIIKLDDGGTLILNNNFKLRDTNKKISDFGVTGPKTKTKTIINNLLFIFLIIIILIEHEFYKFPPDENRKIVNRLMSNEKNLKTIRKSVFAILKTVKSLTFPIVLVQTLFLRNVIFNLFFEGNLKKGYDLTNVLLSYFSNSYLLIFIVLLLPILSEMYKILRLMANYINTNSSIDEPLDLKKKRKYSRIKIYNRRRK
jgi:hypothetical protein